MIGGSFWGDWPGMAALRAELAARLATAPDYEARLDAARRWMKEWHFRVGVHHLRGLIDGFEAGKHYADLAEAVVAVIWDRGRGGFRAQARADAGAGGGGGRHGLAGGGAAECGVGPGPDRDL